MSRVAPRVLALAALLLLAVVAARGATSFTLDPLRLTSHATQNQLAPANSDQLRGNAATSPIPYLGLLLTFIGLLLTVSAAISVLAVIARRKRVRMTTVPGEEETEEGGAYGSLAPLVLAGRQALARLRAHEGGPPSDRVIAAWLSLEHAAMETGTERQPHETPTEFVGSVLAGHEVNREALDHLRRLYGRARFGVEGAMTDADAEAAGDALDRIITDLEAVR
jgi:hypothetical protein